LTGAAAPEAQRAGDEAPSDHNPLWPLRSSGDPRSALCGAPHKAEFERTIIVERTLDGLAAARRAGKRLGRPPKKRRPDPAKVAELRKAGRTWPQIATALRCSERMARRMLDRARQKR
jgi:hypothetical protein